MTARAQVSQDGTLYELGDDIDGVFVPFTSLPVTTVDNRVAAGKAAQDAASTTPSETQQ